MNCWWKPAPCRGRRRSSRLPEFPAQLRNDTRRQAATLEPQARLSSNSGCRLRLAAGLDAQGRLPWPTLLAEQLQLETP